MEKRPGHIILITDSAAMSSLSASYRILRPLNVFLTFGSVLLGGWLAEHALHLQLLLAALAASLIAAAGYVQNDIVDLPVDRISHPDRILPVGGLTLGRAKILSLAGYVSGLLLTAFLPPPCTLAATAITLSLLLYNLRLKKLPLIGNLTVAVMGGAPFVFGGLAVLNPTGTLLPGILATIFHLSREILKDIQDQSGDLTTRGKTLAILIGGFWSKMVVSLLLSTLIIAIPFPAFWGVTGPIYMIIGLGLSALLLLTICCVWQSESEAELEIPSRLLKAGMVVGIAAFFFDSLGAGP
jgi:geranylgeranylglycerol-phosphate geranylgeranyltransferase